MRIFFTLLIVMALTPLSALAQTTEKEGRRHYNSRSVQKAPVYVAPNFSASSSAYQSGNNFVSSGPLDLKRLSRGRSNTNSYSNGVVSPYQGSSYQNNDYSLGLTPDQVRNSRAARNQAAQERQRLIEQQQRGATTPAATTLDPTQVGANASAVVGATPNAPQGQNIFNSPVTINVQKRNIVTAPKRVFNGYD